MILELVIVAGTISLAIGAKGAERARRRRAVATFEAYAKARGFKYVPPPSSPRGASPRIVGEREATKLVFDLYRLGGELRTRVTAIATRGAAPKIAIRQRGAFTRAVAAPGKGFDHAYSTGGATPEERARLLEDVVPALLLLDRQRQGVSLVSTGDRVELSWAGVESDPLVYDAALDAVVAVATWHRPDNPYR